MKNIKIYTNENCPYCKKVKEELKEAKIKFKEVLTKDSKEWTDIANMTGMPQVPTLEFENNYFIAGRDFRDPNHLINLIKNFKKSKFSLELQNLEKTKTLIYNMYSAFGKLDQLLRQIENKLNIKEDEHKSTD